MMKKNFKAIYRLLQRYQNGSLNTEASKLLDVWFDPQSDLQAEFSQPVDESVKKEIWTGISKKLDASVEPEPDMITRKWWSFSYIKAAAACLAILAGLISYQLFRMSTPVVEQLSNAVPGDMSYTLNDGKSVKTFQLPDGSTVKLEPGSALYHPKQFRGGERRVVLKGDAFFEITPNKAMAFVVYSDHITTKVLGTSFTIKKDLRKGNVEVAVISGVVRVVKNIEEENNSVKTGGVTLTPNQKVTYYPETKNLITGLVEQPRQLLINDGTAPSLNFRDAKLSSILPHLEKMYGVKIRLTNENTGNCIITADLSQLESLFLQLDIVCGAIGASYKVEGASVLLTGPGCGNNKNK